MQKYAPLYQSARNFGAFCLKVYHVTPTRDNIRTIASSLTPSLPSLWYRSASAYLQMSVKVYDEPRPETMIFSKNGNYKKNTKKIHKNYISAVFKITPKLLKNYIDIFAVFKITKKIVKKYKKNTICTASRCRWY